MNANKSFPISGQTFTLPEMLELPLRDIPHLGIDTHKGRQCIQTAHFRMDHLARDPKWSALRWVFQTETSEWIPVFHIHKDDRRKVQMLVTMEQDNDDESSLWINPKLYPREQYLYDLEEADE